MHPLLRNVRTREIIETLLDEKAASSKRVIEYLKNRENHNKQWFKFPAVNYQLSISKSRQFAFLYSNCQFRTTRVYMYVEVGLFKSSFMINFDKR